MDLWAQSLDANSGQALLPAEDLRGCRDISWSSSCPEIGTLTLSVIPRKGHKGTGTGSVGNATSCSRKFNYSCECEGRSTEGESRQTSTTQGMSVRPVFEASRLHEKSRARAGGSTLKSRLS